MTTYWSVALTLAAITVLTDSSLAARSQQGRCEVVQVPMCKGLINYNMTKLPNKFGHQTQAEVYWSLQVSAE